MCCLGEFIAKYVLFFTNLVFSLAGLTILGLGVAVLVRVREIQVILPINLLPISVIVLGSIIFLIAFLACCGAIKESRCMLILYSICMLLLAGFKIYLSVVIFGYLDDLQNLVVNWVTVAFNNLQLRNVFHQLERLFSCCGSTGPSSYDGLPLPASCCANPINDTCNAPDAHMGCNILVTEYFETFGGAIGGVLVTIVLIEVALIFMSSFFACRISRRSKNMV